MKTIVFIDGENFLHKIKEVTGEFDVWDLKLSWLLEKVLFPNKADNILFYAAKLHFHKESPRKSEELIQRQRSLKSNLEKQGIDFVIAGNVRAQFISKDKFIYKEKGVDVKLAVDMVSMACDKKIKTAIICSSDSDLQPAVAELKKRGVETMYLGFEINPNKGLAATTDKTILFRNSEVVEAVKKSKKYD